MVLCGVYVMVEKFFVINMEYVLEMEVFVIKYNIYLFINYEIMWYFINYKVYEVIKNDEVGDICKVIVCDGYKGLVKFGINSEFLDWFVDLK